MLDDLLEELEALSPSEKGRAFERLCRWYLESAPEYRSVIKRVWLWSEWPGRWGADAGIDLIAETTTGELWAVQAKAYAPSYTIKKADVDSFLAESSRSQIAYRLLIATTDGLGANAARTLHEQDKPAGVKLVSQLRAEEIVWPRKLRQLRPRAPERKRPREHQREAIRNVVRGLRVRDRGQLLMACGTGKTLTSLWIDERLRSERTLVLVPSLSLLGQSLRAWAASATTPFAYLAVCSDATVTGNDDFTEHATDLGFPVTTDPEQVERFLRRRSGRRVVFSTYQSSPVIADAQTRGVPGFDVAFADEAHRCAGSSSSDFAAVLDASKIKARKRVFMTATPRYLSGRIQRSGAERDYEVVSMDDDAVFGPVLHSLTFGDAIKRDLLADYRVVVVGVDEPTYARYAEHGELVTRDGATVTDARTLARQIGLARAMRRFDLHRVISFHSRVAAARRFADELPDVIAWMPRQARPRGTLWTHHVAGTMNAGQRDALLDRFRQLDHDERGVLANARCLAEGVDVPAIDGAAFIDPRRSTVDIIQAVGRAIRQAPDKTLGTIVIPVFIEPGMNDEEVLDTSAFKPVWDVVRALRAHDDVLADQLDHARRQLGREGGATSKPGKIVLDLPRGITADFATAFDARLVEQTTATWEFWLGLLEHYAERNGDARPTASHVEGGFALGRWVVKQRSHRSTMSPDRVARLEALRGWLWEPFTAQWEEGFAALQAFLKREGHVRVPQGTTEGGFALGQWVAVQRRPTLSPDRAARLEALPGWTWDPRAARWEEGFAALQAFAEREGHARVPQETVEGGYRLGSWVATQRSLRSTMSADRAVRLDALPGWVWDSKTAMWEEGFAALEAFCEREGHARVPIATVEGGYKLGRWVDRQRTGRSTMSANRVARLEALPGWTWDARATMWDEGFAVLQAFADREGHAQVPRGTVERGFRLGTWVGVQRQHRSRSTMSADRVARLEALRGWTWEPFMEQWEEGFAALQAFVGREGHARVPYGNVEGGYALGRWVNRQRQNRSTMSADRVARLQAVPGWVWDARAVSAA